MHGSGISTGALLQLLSESREFLPDIQCSIKVPLCTLEAVATVRFVLMHTSELLAKGLNDSDSNSTLMSSIKALCKFGSTNSDNAGPHIFLLKALFRKCGQSGLQKIINRPHLNWIIPKRISDGLVRYLYVI